MEKNKIVLILVFLTTILYSSHSFSQIQIGTDVYSRYIWRGMDIGNSPSFQPAITFTAGGFSIGAWGAYSFAGISSVYSENDLLTSYSVKTDFGIFTLSYTDYYFPSAGLKLFNYKNDGKGAHTLEAGIGYIGTKSFPLSFSGYINFYNDPDNSSYFEIDYPFSVNNVDISLFVGASGGNSAVYSTNKFSVINTGITFSKEIPVTGKFSLPIHVSYIVNPNQEQSYLIIGLSL